MAQINDSLASHRGNQTFAVSCTESDGTPQIDEGRGNHSSGATGLHLRKTSAGLIFLAIGSQRRFGSVYMRNVNIGLTDHTESETKR